MVPIKEDRFKLNHGPGRQSQSGVRETELPEFREYMGSKYPEIDEDLVTMIEDLFTREKEVARALKSGTIH